MGIISLVITFSFPNLIPDILQNADAEYFENLTLTRPIFSVITVGLFFLFALLAIFIFYGLFTFKPWARKLNLVLNFCVFIIWPILDYSLSSAWARAFGEMASMLWGAVTLLTFVPPISEKFDRVNPSVKRGTP
ncbi:MAG: hypothetical protein Q8N35_01175 [Methylococcaceae bacterium]|nr:hypothetical protein [Methylococcaceae bacterium]MDP3018176.1 hypothetical protein [Methylococcaceae bacterium]MDP3389389.1 hypothetical protein [Methylococcaceae bacterium]MDP3933715.1 hypothetical protein [Methylococcaceae bacterium]